ncbi:MAG TPA: condensation domain-containing protein, partial [Pyrinomonadaceae bacterium]
FRRMVRGVREAALGAYEHQEAPFEKVVEAAGPERRANLSPLFQLKLILQNANVGSLELPGLKLSVLTMGSDAFDFDINVVLFDRPEGFSGYIQYSTDLFDAETISALSQNYETLLRGVLASPDVKLGEIKRILAAADERRRVEGEEAFERARLGKLKGARRRRLSVV